jgi:hypothetical protein
MKSNHLAPWAIGWILVCLGIGPAAARSTDNPFVGDWKLDPSRSKLIDVMKVQRVDADRSTFNFTGGSAETVVMDGTDQPGMSGTTLSVSILRADAWKVVRKKEGRTLITANWQLSRDGDTLTDNFTQIAPDGSSSVVDYVYRRKGPGSGFAGTWVSTSEVIKFVYVLQIRPYGETGLVIANAASSLTRKMKPDGRDYPNSGATAAMVPSSSLRRLDERSLRLTDKGRDGKVYDTQQMSLSPDNGTMTLTIHNAGREEPNILVFERQ